MFNLPREANVLSILDLDVPPTVSEHSAYREHEYVLNYNVKICNIGIVCVCVRVHMFGYTVIYV